MHSTRVVNIVAAGLVLALAAGTPPDPQPFRTQMLLTERIETRERVFARLLFGGRVMIIARERSRLTITEVAGATTIEVQSGRVAITVDRDNLHPEDLVEVRTPHAATTVPGDTLVVEVAEVSTFTPVGRHVDVFRLDPATGAALEPPAVAAADELLTVEAPMVSTGVMANR